MNTRKMFPADWESIQNRIHEIDPVAYGRTRNYTDGAVTRLSPYISRGVIHVRDICDALLARYHKSRCETIIRELAWREYWQRVWENRGDAIFSDLKNVQSDAQNEGVPVALIRAETGIRVIDTAILDWYETGYLHNHLRMYIASITCNRAQYRWMDPSRWMYYHLLDGDLASNALSWQWVAGSFSSKKYWCNQDNINQYTKTVQQHTFLDHSYENLPNQPVPDILREATRFNPGTLLPSSGVLPEKADRIFLYNSYNLDPAWHRGESGCRILLLEPDHFEQYPVSPNVMQFILALSANINNIIVFCGSFHELAERYPLSSFYYKKHPSSMHYRGIAEDPGYLVPGLDGYYPSFSAYWKKAAPRLGYS